MLRQSGESITTVLDKPVTLNLVYLKNGKRFDLSVPSGAQTGVNVFLSLVINVVSQVSTDLLLDFDLSRSFLPGIIKWIKTNTLRKNLKKS